MRQVIRSIQLFSSDFMLRLISGRPWILSKRRWNAKQLIFQLKDYIYIIAHCQFCGWFNFLLKKTYEIVNNSYHKCNVCFSNIILISLNIWINGMTQPMGNFKDNIRPCNYAFLLCISQHTDQTSHDLIISKCMVKFIVLKYYREERTNYSLQDRTYCLQQEKKAKIQVGDIK